MQTLKDICEAHYEAFIYDCSGFLKAVGKDIGIVLSGQANAIIDYMGQNGGWTALGTDAAAAVRDAGQRRLVVGGLKAKGHGHVVIIMPVPAAPWPTAYWGSISKHPGKNKTINWAWNRADLKKVEFFSAPIPSPIAIQ